LPIANCRLPIEKPQNAAGPKSAIGNRKSAMSFWDFAIFPGIAYYFLLPQNQFERLS